MTIQQKNKILITTGIGDTFFSDNSTRKLEYGFELKDKIEKMVALTNTKVYSNFININTQFDTNKSVNVFKNIENSKVLTCNLSVENVLATAWNVFKTTELDNQTNYLLNASDFDFAFPPESYEIHLCGVDLNGFYKYLIPELLKLKYKVVLYSDLMKRFKNTEAVVTSIKHKNFEYCSYKSVTL